MLNFLPVFIQFPLHLTLQVLNLALWGSLILVIAVPKLLLPVPALTRQFNHLLNFCMAAFAFISVGLINLFNRVEWDCQVEGELQQDRWYLMMANHISWLDILLLMRFAGGRIPATKFFIKQELIWMPFIGLGAWALDMPFMRRYSSEFLNRNPHLRGKDIETTKRSCEKFRTIPTSVINFVEGTRFTPQKHARHSSPYRHLLRPKAGGVAFTLATMGSLFSDIIDMTLLYPHNREHVMLDVLSGRLTKVVLHARVLPVREELIGDYHADEDFRQRFQQWLNQLWAHKDNYIRRLLEAE